MYKATRLRKRGESKAEAIGRRAFTSWRLLFHAATLTTLEIALVLVRLDQITRCIVDANHRGGSGSLARAFFGERCFDGAVGDLPAPQTVLNNQ